MRQLKSDSIAIHCIRWESQPLPCLVDFKNRGVKRCQPRSDQDRWALIYYMLLLLYSCCMLLLSSMKVLAFYERRFQASFESSQIWQSMGGLGTAPIPHHQLPRFLCLLLIGECFKRAMSWRQLFGEQHSDVSLELMHYALFFLELAFCLWCSTTSIPVSP